MELTTPSEYIFGLFTFKKQIHNIPPFQDSPSGMNKSEATGSRIFEWAGAGQHYFSKLIINNIEVILHANLSLCGRGLV